MSSTVSHGGFQSLSKTLFLVPKDKNSQYVVFKSDINGSSAAMQYVYILNKASTKLIYQ